MRLQVQVEVLRLLAAKADGISSAGVTREEVAVCCGKNIRVGDRLIQSFERDLELVIDRDHFPIQYRIRDWGIINKERLTDGYRVNSSVARTGN